MGTREQMLAEMATGIGGSESAAACGFSRWTSRVQLYLEKRGELPRPDLSEDISVQAGIALEPLVLACAERELGACFKDQGEFFRSAEFPHMLCHLDARLSPNVIIEAKTAASDEDWGDAGTDQIPADYLFQCHHNLAVTNARVCLVPVIFSGCEFRMYEVQRDAEIMEEVIAREAEFWQRVQTGDYPPLDTANDVALFFRQDDGQAVQADVGVAARIADLLDLHRAMKATAATHAALLGEIKKAMGGAARLLDGEGGILATWKTNKPSRVTDWRQLAVVLREQLINVRPDYEPYCDAAMAAATREKPGARPFLLKHLDEDES